MEEKDKETAQRGILVRDGKPVDSEIIYWKIVPGDKAFESPITPHHGEHHDRYMTFEYDNGGWNNVRSVYLQHREGKIPGATANVDCLPRPPFSHN